MGVPNVTRWVGVVPFSNLLPHTYPQVGGDGPNYPWGLGSFLRLSRKYGIGFFLGPGDIGTCLDFQFA
jgi:hypothetical protein